MQKRGKLATERAQKIAAFKQEVLDVCKKGGFSISHEDAHGAFLVEEWDQHKALWFQQAVDQTQESYQ